MTIVVLAGLLVILYGNNFASAAELSKFDAGNIIDDSVFYDPKGLNESEIQQLLNAKTPVCDTWGTQPYKGTTRANYAASSGVSTPFTCLKDYVENINAKPADAYCSGYPNSRKTSAEIIYAVSQSCGINPRVLIVLLQKEQGLITDDWPWPIQYQSATGMGCPDTASCDSQYYGFFNQLYSASRQFKKYKAWPNDYNFIPNRNNFIKWHPDFDSGRRTPAGQIIWEDRCGGANVYIKNQATAGLYNYTPYQPNAAALRAGYGDGDGCSAYGNRNFWSYYNDWFGSTFTPAYYWSFVSQNIYHNDKMDPVAKPFVKGERRFVQIKIKNSGASTWYRWQTNLGTSNPRDRKSNLYDPSWLTENRAATIKESSVSPGSIATFEFWVTGNESGNYLEYFNPVHEGVTWMNDNGMYLPFTVEQPTHTWTVSEQALFADSNYTQPLPWLASVTKGEKIFGRVVALNTGNTTWSSSGPTPVKIATGSPRDRWSAFCNSTWGGCMRPTVLKETSVEPGQKGTFEFELQATTIGSFREYFQLVREGVSWFNDPGMYFPIEVHDRQYKWSIIEQSQYKDLELTQQLPYNMSLARGESAYIMFKVRNDGNMAWNKAVVMATSSPRDRASLIKSDQWISANRPAVYNETNLIRPGETATFVFKITGNTPGIYKEYFNLVWEGQSWFNDLGAYIPLTVQPN